LPLPVIAALVQPCWGSFFHLLCKILHVKIETFAVNLEVRKMRREFISGAKGFNEVVCCVSRAVRKDVNDTAELPAIIAGFG